VGLDAELSHHLLDARAVLSPQQLDDFVARVLPSALAFTGVLAAVLALGPALLGLAAFLGRAFGAGTGQVKSASLSPYCFTSPRAFAVAASYSAGVHPFVNVLASRARILASRFMDVSC
jgi:hypothetical protein